MKKTIFGFVVLAIAFTFGTMMSCSEKVEEVAMTVAQVNDSIANLVDDTIFVEGTVEDICPCGGMKLADANFKCVWTNPFDTALKGKTVRIRGILREEQIMADVLTAKLDEIRAQANDTVTEEVPAEGEAVAPKEGCCGKEEGKCCGKEGCEKHEGEHNCAGKCCNDSNKIIEMLQKIEENGLGYFPKYSIEVISCDEVVAEPAK